MIPNVSEVEVINKLLNQALTLKLYSNNVTPAEADIVSSYTEVTGGGYAAKTLAFVSWTVVAGSPTHGTYAIQSFVFTGATTGPGTIYGYYVVDANGILLGSEAFPGGPYTPIANSIIRVTPKISVE